MMAFHKFLYKVYLPKTLIVLQQNSTETQKEH